MSKSKTPICDLIEGLLSRDLSPAAALDQARGWDAALASGGVAAEMKRYQSRMKKQSQRAKKCSVSPGQGSLDISSTTSQQTQGFQEGKKDSYVAVVDDWPENFREAFWSAYPPGRKYDRPKVFKKLEKLRAEKTVTWTALMAGLERFKATRPDPQFTPAPLVWLNGHRWEGDYGNGGPNGPTPTGGNPRNSGGGGDSIAAAAARRFSGNGRNGPASGTGAPVQPSRRSGDERDGAGGGEDAAFNFGATPGR